MPIPVIDVVNLSKAFGPKVVLSNVNLQVQEGESLCVMGGSGTGKTVLLEALAKGCNADVIVYLGCGERGNEMAGVLEEFPDLRDPKNDRPLWPVSSGRSRACRNKSFARPVSSRIWPINTTIGFSRSMSVRD